MLKSTNSKTKTLLLFPRGQTGPILGHQQGGNMTYHRVVVEILKFTVMEGHGPVVPMWVMLTGLPGKAASHAGEEKADGRVEKEKRTHLLHLNPPGLERLLSG